MLRARRLQTQRQIDFAGVLRRNPGSEQREDDENRHQHHSCRRQTIAAAEGQQGRGSGCDFHSYRTTGCRTIFFSAFMKISFCSGVPMVTRIAFGIPQAVKDRTMTPSACMRLAKELASSSISK